MVQENQLKRTFGQAYRSKHKSRNGPSRYQRQQGSSSYSSSSHSRRELELTEEQEKAQRRLAQKLKRRQEDEIFDANNGFQRFCFSNSFGGKEGKHDDSGNRDGAGASGGVKERRGWIFNMLPTVSFKIHFVLPDR